MLPVNWWPTQRELQRRIGNQQLRPPESDAKFLNDFSRARAQGLDSCTYG